MTGPALVTESCEFWFVWTTTGHIPRHVHSTHLAAEAEADRLAALHPGRKFIILKAYRKVHVPLDEVTAPALSNAEGGVV